SIWVYIEQGNNPIKNDLEYQNNKKEDYLY
ncbi:hypothetical protein SKO_02732, partial [Enterococcus faecium EnGen0170]